jgi:hypothetical protein
MFRHFKRKKFLPFFHFWGTILTCLDPDPLTQVNMDPIHIRNTVLEGHFAFKTFYAKLCRIN